MTSSPDITLLHVLTGPDGLTCTHRCTVQGLTMQQVGSDIPPVWATDPVADTRSRAVWVLPPGWRGGWHRNPSRQWVIPISGRWWVETQDGTRTEMGPGDIHLGDDLDARPDAEGRIGHDSGVIGDEPLVVMIVALDGSASACVPALDRGHGR